MLKKLLFTSGTILVVAVLGYWYWNTNYRIKPVKLITTNSTGTGLLAKVIKSQGIDKKHRFTLESVHYSPGDLERRLHEHEAEIGDHSLIALADPIQKGQNLKILLATYHANHLIVVPNESSVKTLPDIKGKKIAILPKGSAGYVTFVVTMKEQGIDVDSQTNLLFFANPHIVKFLTNGDAHVAVVSHPAITSTLLTGKYRTLAKMEDLWKEKTNRSEPFVVLVAHEEWLNKNKALASRVRDAYLEAAQLVRNNPGVLTQETEFLNSLGIKTDEAKELMKKSIKYD